MTLRPLLFRSLLSGLLVLAAPLSAQEHTMPRATVPPAAFTPEMSDRLGYEQAVADGTNAALIFFLAREPQNPYAPEVRTLLATRDRPDPPGAALRIAGPSDAGIVAAYDAARLAGDFSGFLARHGSHPLAAEARAGTGLPG